MPKAFGEVTGPWWDDAPAIVVGTGPSLAGFDFSRLEGLGHILAVKEAMRDLPFAEAVFGLDIPWMRRQAEYLAALRCELYLAVPDSKYRDDPTIPNATYLVRTRIGDKLSEDAAKCESGGNSGFGGLNIAYLKRAKTIFLFGYDYSADHYCPERYAHHSRHHNARYWPRWAKIFATTLPQLSAAGVTVFNASPDSTIDAFPKVSIDEAIERLDRLRRARG